MVCSKCEKKLSQSMHQEMWKVGSRHTIEGGGRKLNENKAGGLCRRNPGPTFNLLLTLPPPLLHAPVSAFTLKERQAPTSV
jgi:hypothetical protein